MEIEKGNRFYDENVNRDEFENNFNTFTEGMVENRNENRKDGRPRFVRADSGNRQYTRVERPSRKSDDNQEGYGQERPRRQYNRQSDGQYGQERPYYSQNRQSGYQSRGGQGTYGRSQYGQERPRYNYNQSRQNENSQDTQPRFYRERVQGQDGGQQRGYQRQYRPRQEGGYQRQGGYGRQPYGQGGYQQRGYRKPVQNRPDSRKRIEYHDVVHDPNEEIRLNKYLANAGVCSRREADDFIQAGVVKVNGQTVTELGVKVRRGDNVLFHDQIVSIERKIYILLNKPKDCVTTVDDPQERRTVMDCIKGACKERVYPVGRLDRNTTGVLLLTNDGELATRLTHPKFLKKKIYHVRLDRAVASEDMQTLLNGVKIGEEEGDVVRADEVSYVNDDKTQVGIEIHSGRNRVVRRMFDALGYRVIRLDRVQFAGLTKKRLRRGDWRFLTEKEVNMLRMGAYE